MFKKFYYQKNKGKDSKKESNSMDKVRYQNLSEEKNKKAKIWSRTI